MPTAAKSKNLFAFLGTDEARVKEAAMECAKKLAPADDEFALETISGQADNSDHAAQIVGQTIEAIQTLPFFGGEKVVWLQSANFFGDSVTGRAQATLSAMEALTDLLEVGIPPDVQFVISATEIDKRRTCLQAADQAHQAGGFRQGRHFPGRLGNPGDGTGFAGGQGDGSRVWAGSTGAIRLAGRRRHPAVAERIGKARDLPWGPQKRRQSTTSGRSWLHRTPG